MMQLVWLQLSYEVGCSFIINVRFSEKSVKRLRNLHDIDQDESSELLVKLLTSVFLKPFTFPVNEQFFGSLPPPS